ncbi:MAG TPA: EpsI family protein [Longimicrobiales bacterium]
MKRGMLLTWGPAIMLAAGSLGTVGIAAQKDLPLRAPLESSIPSHLFGLDGVDQPMSDAERNTLGVDDYVIRSYGETAADSAGANAFSVYVGYYTSQMSGRTIHSPKNCLPGSGWEALSSRAVVIPTADGAVTVNRYLLQNGDHKALALYWYQGRGRIESNEYVVKWDLLRDAALRRRSDEALVRILVPITTDEEAAFETAARVAGTIVPAVHNAIPL